MIWPYIIISYFSLFVFGLTDNLRGPLFPEILNTFEISDSFGSWMFAISSISGFAASYVARHLLRRFDRKSVLQGGCLSMIFGLLGLAWSPQFNIFLGFSFLLGLSLGIIGLIPNVLVSLGAPPHLKQRLLSGLHAMYGLASFCAPLVVAQVGAITGSWRPVFLVAIAGPLSLLLYSLHSTHHNLHEKPERKPEQPSLRKSHPLIPQLFIACMLSFDVAGEIMISSRLALFMRREWNFDLQQSSLYVTYFFIAMLVGRALFAIVHFRSSIRTLLSTSIVLTLAAGFAGLYIHPLFLALTGFTIAPFYPLSIAFFSSEFPEDLDSAVSYMMAMDSLMLVFMHLVVGRMTDLWGIHQAILIGMGFFACSFIFLNSYNHVFRKKNSPTTGIRPS
ncbi:MAG TPA: MFS transporter [Pseudobdellovibrionaceae bacterium]|jgi:fucose permease